MIPFQLQRKRKKELKVQGHPTQQESSMTVTQTRKPRFKLFQKKSSDNRTHTQQVHGRWLPPPCPGPTTQRQDGVWGEAKSVPRISPCSLPSNCVPSPTTFLMWRTGYKTYGHFPLQHLKGGKVEKIKLVRADLKILLADYKITLIFTTKNIYLTQTRSKEWRHCGA